MSVRLSPEAKAWCATKEPSRMSEKAFKDCVAEFRQYGYDPYNSADDAQHWYAWMEHASSLARAVPA